MLEEAGWGRNGAVRPCLRAPLAEKLGSRLDHGEKLKALESKSRSAQTAVWAIRRCQWHMWIKLLGDINGICG